jgi:hypothetical protein
MPINNRSAHMPTPTPESADTHAALKAFIAHCKRQAAKALEAEAKRLMAEAQKLREVT